MYRAILCVLKTRIMFTALLIIVRISALILPQEVIVISDSLYFVRSFSARRSRLAICVRDSCRMNLPDRIDL